MDSPPKNTPPKDSPSFLFLSALHLMGIMTVIREQKSFGKESSVPMACNYVLKETSHKDWFSTSTLKGGYTVSWNIDKLLVLYLWQAYQWRDKCGRTEESVIHSNTDNQRSTFIICEWPNDCWVFSLIYSSNGPDKLWRVFNHENESSRLELFQQEESTAPKHSFFKVKDHPLRTSLLLYFSVTRWAILDR